MTARLGSSSGQLERFKPLLRTSPRLSSDEVRSHGITQIATSGYNYPQVPTPWMTRL